MMELDGTGRGPAGGKRIANLVSKLSAGGAASEADIRTAVDDFYEPSADGGGKQSQLTYECLALLCDAAGAGECGGAVVGGGRFSDCEAFLERLCFRLEQDRAQQKRKSASDGADVEISAIQLVANLPDEQLCKLLANREATTTLQGYVAEHPNAALRAFSISRLTSACTRCWSFLDRRAFLNGGCEEGGDAQRYKQRVRDWMYDFFSSLPKLCDDPSDAVSAAAFCAIGTLMGEHPLCTTLVDEDLRRFWGLEGGQQRHTTQMESRRGPWVGFGTSDGLFGRHKQVFPMQHVGEIILRSALPRIRRLLHRQSRMVLAREAHVAAPAIRTCAFLVIAALRLSTSSTGTPVKHALLETPTSVDFLGLKSDLRNGSAGGKNGAASTVGGEHKEQEDLDATPSPKELAVEWMNVRLRAILEEGRDGDAQLMEAAAWATLRVLHTVMMAQLRASTAPRVAEAFLRVLMVGQAATPKRLLPPLHAGQQEVAAGSALALRLASPSAAVALAPHVLAAAERVPQPRQRLSLLADTFFILLVRPGRNGRAPCGFGGARGAHGAGTGVRSNSNGDGDGGGESNGFSRGKGGGARGRGGAPRTGARMLVSVLEQDYFAQLVYDSPSSCRTRRLVFREEAVAALTTTCAQVLAAGVVSVLSSTAEEAAALGIGTLARSCHSHDAAVAAAAAAAKEDLLSSRTANGGPVHNETADFAATVSAAAAARAAAAAEKGRWSDLETWLDCSLSALETCARCVNWTSVVGYVGGLAYVRLLSLVLRLLCPLTAAEVDEIGGGSGDGVFTDGIRSSGRFCGDGRSKRTKEQSETLDDGEKAGGTGRREFSWARQRLAQVVDDLMWRLREGLPGRDVRLRLLQATCTHVRLSALVGGDDRLTEDSANELVSVLQGELGELDAQAGISTQPLRAPAATIEEGDDEAGGGDNANRRDANGGRGGGGGSSSSTTTAATAAAPGGGGGGAQNPPPGLVGGEAQEGDDETADRENGGGVGGQEGGSAVSFAGRRGSLTDVMAHELVIDCLVRLALVAEGEAAHEVLSVLEHERGRAHTRERLGRGAIGPMEEVVTKGIRAVQLLVLQTSSTSLKGTAGSSQAILLRRFLGTMDLGWQAAVQPDERAVTGSSAGVFDHGAHAFPHLHQRLRSLLCGGVGVDLANDDEKRSRRERSGSGEKVGTVPSHFEAHAWEEEAPHAQLNGGSDPVVVTASHVVHCGGIGSGGRAGQGDKALGPTATMLAWDEGFADATVAPGGVAGKVASRGVRIRIRVYNGTNSRLHGFSIRLSFGQGGEAEGMGGGGRVESTVQEVLMPSAVHTLEIPVMPLVVLADVIVHVSVVFPDTEPEPEFESEGIAELLGVETTPKEGGGGAEGTSHFGPKQPAFDGGGVGAEGGEGGIGGGGGVGGSIPVVLQAGSYRVPAEVFLGPPERAAGTWVGFQTVWSGLPYVTVFPVESLCCRPPSGPGQATGESPTGALLHTAQGVRLAVTPTCARRTGSGCSTGTGCDSRAAAAVECPVGNTDYAVSLAWAFEAWDGTPFLCALTAMKAPFSVLPPSTGTGAGGGGGQPSWFGRLEVRCGSRACSEFADRSSVRLTRYVTNGVFAPPVAADHRHHHHHPQPDPFGGAFPPTPQAALGTGGGGGGGGGGGSSELNGTYPDWFSRTDTAQTGSLTCQSGDLFTTESGKVNPVVRALWEHQRVDTTKAATVSRQAGRVGALGVAV